MIYFDNAATTPIYDECLQIIEEYGKNIFFNPSARYSVASKVALDIKKARESFADLLGVTAQEIFYVSSGSEADNTVLKGAVKSPKDRIIISDTEHSAIYNTAIFMRNKGYDVQIAKVNKNGSVDIDNLISLLTPNTRLVSIMHVNNETGAINDIANIVKMAKENCPNALIHSDGVQAFGKIPVNLKKLGVDMYSIGGHKIHGPKGIGVLYVKNGISINPLIHGGGQESGVRSSTENVPGIIALTCAAKKTISMMEESSNVANAIKKRILDRLDEEGIKYLNNNGDNASPYILSLSFEDVRGEVLLHCLEEDEIYISTGSACSTKKGISRIPSALKLTKELAEGTIRVSFSNKNTLQEADVFCDKAIKYIKELRQFRRK